MHHPGLVCYRKPSWPGPLPYKVDSNPRAKARIVAGRVEAGQRLGEKVVDLIPAKPPALGNVLAPARSEQPACKPCVVPPVGHIGAVWEIDASSDGEDTRWTLRDLSSVGGFTLTVHGI